MHACRFGHQGDNGHSRQANGRLRDRASQLFGAYEDYTMSALTTLDSEWQHRHEEIAAELAVSDTRRVLGKHAPSNMRTIRYIDHRAKLCALCTSQRQLRPKASHMKMVLH